MDARAETQLTGHAIGQESLLHDGVYGFISSCCKREKHLRQSPSHRPRCRHVHRYRRSSSNRFVGSAVAHKQHVHGDQRGGFVGTTNLVNTVKSGRNVAGLCSPLRGRALIAAPPGEVHVGQEGDTAFQTYVSALDGCMLVSSSCDARPRNHSTFLILPSDTRFLPCFLVWPCNFTVLFQTCSELSNVFFIVDSKLPFFPAVRLSPRTKFSIISSCLDDFCLQSSMRKPQLAHGWSHLPQTSRPSWLLKSVSTCGLQPQTTFHSANSSCPIGRFQNHSISFYAATCPGPRDLVTMKFGCITDIIGHNIPKPILMFTAHNIAWNTSLTSIGG